MRTHSLYCALAIGLAWISAESIHAQCTEGRIFLPTDETVAIWEMNDLPVAPGEVLPNGTVIPDLSGNGLDAVVEGNVDTVVAGTGDPEFNVPPGDPNPATLNTTAGKINEAGPPRIAVNNDRDTFEMDETQDFSVELYVRRDAVPGTAQWGILAGTWHSRTLIDDGGNPDVDGAWYGWGFIQRGGLEPPGWLWVGSPVNPDGTLRGTGCCNEQRNDVPWEIPEGSHYIVASVDRTLQQVAVYLDSAEVETVALGPNDSFITPNDYEHARFMMLTGEDDSTRNVYRTAPSGYHIDAVRIQKKALSAIEVEDNYFATLDGVPSPPDAAVGQAVLSASRTEALVGQCVRLSGEASCVGPGLEITQYEWKVDDGPFEVGEATRELSFDAPSGPGGTAVTLRVTDSGGGSSTSTVHINVRHPAVIPSFAVNLDSQILGGSEIIIPLGSELTLDATASASELPAGTLTCPIADGVPLAPVPISSYSWDLDGDGSEDASQAVVTFGPANELGVFRIRLTVENDVGSSAAASVQITVSDAQGNSRVFHTTPDTLLHLEFNSLDPGVLDDPDLDGDVGVVPDLSEFGQDMTLVSPVLDPPVSGLEVEPGAPHFADNKAVTNIAPEPGHRGEVRQDNQLYEMAPEEDFTFEIYVRPSDQVAPQWGDVAGTFKARTDGTDGSPRYGWGIIKSHLDQENKPGFAWITPNQTPDELPVFFNLEAGRFSYVACVVDRVGMTSTVYVNGQLASLRIGIDPAWSFETPLGFPHAPFYIFTREQTDGEFHNCPVDTTVDALRLQGRALTGEEVALNWQNIVSGQGANPEFAPDGEPGFVRGDADSSGRINLTDGVQILNWLFLGGPEPDCLDAADTDDTGTLNLTDAVRIFNWLFTGGPAPVTPSPTIADYAAGDCGRDETPDGDGDLGCATTANKCL